MILLGQYDSPFTRRVAVSMHMLGLAFERDTSSVFADADAVRRLNPLGRIPVLVLDDGEVLIDSGAILDHLDERVGPDRALTPPTGSARRRELLGEERRLTAAVLVHLGEVEARELYLPAACSSMHAYSTRVLGMSDDQAYKRIRAARAVRRFPVIGTAVADGRLHLSGVLLLAAHLSEDNAEELVAEASGKSKAEIQILLARRAPKPDVPPRLEPVGQQLALAPGAAGTISTRQSASSGAMWSWPARRRGPSTTTWSPASGDWV
jgi:glutathione S-transferase